MTDTGNSRPRRPASHTAGEASREGLTVARHPSPSPRSRGSGGLASSDVAHGEGDRGDREYHKQAPAHAHRYPLWGSSLGGIDVTLHHLAIKREQAQRLAERAGPVLLGLPTTAAQST
jgi:hypothetical protein